MKYRIARRRVGRGERAGDLNHRANQLAQAPGRLLRFDTPGGPTTVVANNLISPTDMAPDFANGVIFVTEIFTGRIIRVGI